MGRDGCSRSRCVAREGGSLPGVQAGFASRWSQGAYVCSSHASPCTRVFSWSPQDNTILGMVYSSKRMKRRSLRSVFTSYFCSSLAVGRSCTRSCRRHQRASWYLLHLRCPHTTETAGPGSELPAQEGSPKHFQEGCGGIQQTSLTHAPLRQLKPPGPFRGRFSLK